MLETAFVNALLADSDLADLIVDRVEPIALAADAVLPYVAYAITQQEDPSPTHDGPSSLTRSTFDIVTVAETYADVVTITAHVKRILGNLSVITDSVEVFWTRWQDNTDIEQQIKPGEEKPLYVRADTFRAMYRLPAGD